ncbi:hypothetical protein [Pedobacter sp. GR22-10]|uniref:hypothetical protein n=1 Tax=Pedobacter sp. GR22-10 TaxID=2994472 RepID=UPI002248508B|nr:hypothetical protein [Pedobacter sp. GR22-10]MCX2430900.1 hypothetical protein [Pedobacter sp. GR22-10]
MKVALKSQYLRRKDGASYSTLINYYQGSRLNKNSESEDYERVARKFIDDFENEIIVISKHSISLEDDEVFTFTKVSNPNERFYWFFNFLNFYKALNNILEDFVPRSFSSEGAERQAVLTKDAFRMIGHNETKIKHSKSSYSRLFE